MITLTTEQAQQIEEALVNLCNSIQLPTSDVKALATIRAARAQKQAEQEPVAQQDSDDKRLLREIFMLCEATEELEPTNDFMRGRIFEAKGIRRSIGTWYQDTFCGRSYMGEPVLNAAPVQQAEQEPVAWMSPNKERLEFSRKDTVYGSHTIPLYAAPVRTKDLTDDEIFECYTSDAHENTPRSFARAVIAADREKNK